MAVEGMVAGIIRYRSVSQTLLLAGPVLASKNNHGSSHLAHVNIVCPNKHPKLTIYKPTNQNAEGVTRSV
jgi:hypothetical protein